MHLVSCQLLSDLHQELLVLIYIFFISRVAMEVSVCVSACMLCQQACGVGVAASLACIN